MWDAEVAWAPPEAEEAKRPPPVRAAGRRPCSGRVLIVEDEYLLAHDLAQELGDAGIEHIGPVASVEQALRLVEDGRVDGAVLDVSLQGELVYPVADALAERGVPFVFVTGYSPAAIPRRFAGAPYRQKPVCAGQVIEALERGAAA